MNFYNKEPRHMADKMMTGEFRVSYANVLKPQKKETPESPDKFSMSMIFNKKKLKDPAEKAAFIALKAACEAMAAAEHAAGCKRPMPIRDGDEKEWKGEGESPYAGAYYCECTTKFAPECFDRNKQDILSENEFYNGCYARARVHVYAWHNNGGGVSVGFDAVQKLKDGDKIGGGGDAKTDFDDLGDAPAAAGVTESDDLLM